MQIEMVRQCRQSLGNTIAVEDSESNEQIPENSAEESKQQLKMKNTPGGLGTGICQKSWNQAVRMFC